jgi:TonB family protein
VLSHTTEAQSNAFASAFNFYPADVEIIYPQESRPLDAEKLGSVKLKKGSYLACDIDNQLAFAKSEALEKGGNALYITSIKPPKRGKNCYLIEADIYKLNSPYNSTPNPFYRHEVLTASTKNTSTEILPEFPAGINEILPFIYRKFIYPNSALRDKIGGKIVVSFEVDETGKVIDVQVDEGIRWDMDQELLRVISTMPEWVPGYQNGKAVPVLYKLPVKLYPWLTNHSL